MNRSLTITGLVASLVGFTLHQSGFEVSPGELDTFATILLQLAGIFIAWYGRVRKGDISLFGKRKTKS